MICRYSNLKTRAKLFLVMTGLQLQEFEILLEDVSKEYGAMRGKRLKKEGRQRAVGGGMEPCLQMQDQVLLTIIWLRHYPIHEVLGYLFGVSDTTSGRVTNWILPILEKLGRDQMKMPDPGRKRRKKLHELLSEIPDLSIAIDTFEQRIERAKDHKQAVAHYSGKKKQHTLKTQVAIDVETGEIVDVSESKPGPQADIKVLEESGLMNKLATGVGVIGDLAYIGITDLHPEGNAATPRRKPRGKERPPEDIAFNREFARRRVVAEHSIGRMRRYQALTQMDRNHCKNHASRTCAVAGLANRQIRAGLRY